MAYHEWHVGMKVVCVDAAAHNKYAPPRDKFIVTGNGIPTGLEVGRVYTIREVLDFYGVLSVRLHEIVRVRSKFGHEVPFAAARFRPVQPRKTDISVFTAMLNPQKHEVDA